MVLQDLMHTHTELVEKATRVIFVSWAHTQVLGERVFLPRLFVHSRCEVVGDG